MSLMINPCFKTSSWTTAPPSSNLNDNLEEKTLPIIHVSINLSSQSSIKNQAQNTLNQKQITWGEYFRFKSYISELKSIQVEEIVKIPPNVSNAEICELMLSFRNRLKKLDLSGCKQITNLVFLRWGAALTHLNLSNCENIQNFSFIKGLHNLISLNLSDCKISNLDFIKRLQKLSSLSLVGCNQIVDFRPLQTLKLNYCDLTETYFPDLSLLNPDRLKVLILFECSSIISFSLLRNFINLEVLDLSWCKLQDFQEIECTNLKILRLTGLFEIVNFSFVGRFQFLEELSLSGCQITSLAPLNSLGRLKKLNLSETNIKNLQGIECFDELEELNLINCTKLSKMTPALLGYYFSSCEKGLWRKYQS